MKIKVSLVALIFVTLAYITVTASQSPQDTNAQVVEDDTKLKKFDVVVKTRGNNHELKQQFQVGETIFVEVSLTNKSKKKISLILNNEKRENRLFLLKDGVTVPYRADVMERFAAEEQDEELAQPVGSFESLQITPNETALAVFTELSRWYEPLEPGKYELSVERRFNGSKLNPHLPKPVKSSIVRFEVVP